MSLATEQAKESWLPYLPSSLQATCVPQRTYYLKKERKETMKTESEAQGTGWTWAQQTCHSEASSKSTEGEISGAPGGCRGLQLPPITCFPHLWSFSPVSRGRGRRQSLHIVKITEWSGQKEMWSKNSNERVSRGLLTSSELCPCAREQPCWPWESPEP